MKSCRHGRLFLSRFLGLSLLVLCTCSLITIAYGDSNLPCVNQNVTETHVATLTADAYVKVGSGTNYGSEGNLIVGNYSDGAFYETFLMFDLPSSPIVWATLTFTYYASRPNIPLNISIYTTAKNWDQNAITWMTKPGSTKKQGTVQASPLDIGLLYFKFEFTINSDLNNTMSLCLNATSPVGEGYIVGKSGEGANFAQEKPLLEYGVTVTQCVTVPGYDVLLIFTFSALTIFLVSMHLKKKWMKPYQKQGKGGKLE